MSTLSWSSKSSGFREREKNDDFQSQGGKMIFQDRISNLIQFQGGHQILNFLHVLLHPLLIVHLPNCGLDLGHGLRNGDSIGVVRGAVLHNLLQIEKKGRGWTIESPRKITRKKGGKEEEMAARTFRSKEYLVTRWTGLIKKEFKGSLFNSGWDSHSFNVAAKGSLSFFLSKVLEAFG